MNNAISRSFQAAWVIPDNGPPISRGVVETANGQIVRVGNSTLADSKTVDLGDVLLLPGFVNAHTHLEFSSLSNPLPQTHHDFAKWIREVINWRRHRDEFRAESSKSMAISTGLNESHRSGSAVVGEIATSPWLAEPLTSHAVQSVMFLEQFGVFEDQSDNRLDEIRSALEANDSLIPKGSRKLGISPHAPYSLSQALFRGLIELAREYHLPVAMHLAESCDEMNWLNHRTGPIAEFLDSMGMPIDDQHPLSITDYIQALSSVEHAMIIHGNYLQREEIETIGAAKDRVSVVYCPRTHLYFEHERYPLEQFLAYGINVAIGTDSRASNPDLDVLPELQLVRRQFPLLDPMTIFRMGTLNSAIALGWADSFGSINENKSATLLIVDCPVDIYREPLEWLLTADRPSRRWLNHD